MASFPSDPVYMTLAERDALIARVNPAENFVNADDKIVTAALAKAAGIPHVPVHDVVETHDGIAAAVEKLPGLPSFAIKPARGMGGSGIIVAEVAGDGFRTTDGAILTAHDLRTHFGNILDGLYSMRAQPDRAIIQHRIQPHPFFTALHGDGVADIRVIVYLGRPVMAMLRLPTRESGGKGNLHAGAVGVGIDMATGMTTHAVYRGCGASTHPDTGVVLVGHGVPQWPAILKMAAASAAMTGLGLLGADIVGDAALGLLLLEVNTRPGLAIQQANRMSLQASV